MTYTFLPAIARGSGLSVTSLGQVLSIRELTSLSAPFTGRATDSIGPMRIMAYSGVLASLGLLLALGGTMGIVVGMIVFGFGRTAYQVAMRSWVADAVSYERRGRATGLIELTWGGASLIGLPVVGFLIASIRWWAPFLFLGVAALVVSVRIATYDPSTGRTSSSTSRKPHMSRFAIAAIATNGSITAAAQFLFLGHGLWLEDTYGLNTAEIGLAIVAVGFVEVIATLGSSRLTDRLGKRWSMLAGTLVMTAAMIVLAIFSAPPLLFGLLLLAIAFLGFEFGIVSAIPLLSELDPGARAQMIGRDVSVSTVIRAIITFVASAIYVRSGFSTLMGIGAAAGVLACLLAVFAMTEPDPELAITDAPT